MNIKNIAIIGSGNLAWHLGKHLNQLKKYSITIYSRNYGNAEELAQTLICKASRDINSLPKEDTIWIICISDNEIENLAQKLPFDAPFCVHTAGSVPLKIFSGHLKCYGALYPLQTFTRGFDINFSEVSFFIEANNNETLTTLKTFAREFSDTVIEIDSDKRKILHLAAVIAGNFSNHMYSLAHDVLSDNNLDFSYLQPLLEATLQKAFAVLPNRAQTGPAVRGNFNVINDHLELLKGYPQIQKIYSLLSESIYKLGKTSKSDG